MSDRQRGIEEQIRQAIEAGVFDDLPGKGKPLKLDVYPFESQDWSLAHHILRSSGYTLPWIESRREIEDDLDATRQELKRAFTRFMSLQYDDTQTARQELIWQQAVERFRKHVADINTRIQNYNLEVPTNRFQRLKINVHDEIEAIKKMNSTI